MKLSVAFLSLLALAAALPVPEIHTVYTTAFTTVLRTVVAGEPPAATDSVAAAETTATTAATPATTAATPVTTAATPATTAAPAATTSTPATTSATTSAAPAASSLPAASGSGSFSGQGTYYAPGLGACGVTSLESDFIVAISHELYDANAAGANPNNNPLCGKKITAFYEGNSVEVTVVDRCEGCKYYDLDFSPSAFSKLANQDLGRIDITWEWA